MAALMFSMNSLKLKKDARLISNDGVLWQALSGYQARIGSSV